MDPASMPAWGSAQGSAGNLSTALGEALPMVTSYHGAQTGVDVNQIGNSTASQESDLAKFGQFLGGVAGQTGHIALDAAKWLGQQGLSMATAPVRFGAGIGHDILDHMTLDSIQKQNQQNSARMDQLTSQYKSGRLTKAQYLSGLNSLMQDQHNTTSQENALLHRLPADQSNAVQGAIDTASAILTIATGGFGKAADVGISLKGLSYIPTKTAADYLMSTNANVFMDSAEKAISKVASDPEIFAKLSPMAQRVIQTGVADVVSQGERMTAGQITRAAAMNIALKYPLYYNWMSPTGTQLYQELDQKKYGDAVRTVAFNAALLLSGGPIGWAMNKLGAVGTIAHNALFGRTAFLDELSKGIGNGDPAGLFSAVNKITDPAVKADVIKQLSAVEATNLKAVGGDAQAAAWRVIKGMASYEGVTLDSFTHEEALNNMVTYAKAQRLADFWGKKLNMGPITVGRLDARSLDTIAAGLTKADQAAATPGDVAAALPQESAVDMSGAPDFLKPAGETPPEGLPKGYTMDEMGQVKDPSGRVLKIGEIQELHQASYLTEYEHARSAGDTATMDRIAKEHPMDERVNFDKNGASNMAPDAKASLLAKFRAQAAAQSSQETVSPIDQRLKTWEDLKAQNLTQAWAHNENFDRQVKGLIQKYENPSELDAAIRKVKASFAVDGLPESVSRELAQMGYLPIKPVDLEAPFTEGNGKVASKFAQQNDNFFLKAVQPLPVLSFLGNTLTKFGLSPDAANQRVYQVFNDYLSKNLQDAKVIPNMVGEDAQQTTDTLVKQLADYAHNPPGKLQMPITDLRMMTLKDIRAATGATAGEAVQIQRSISRAYTQVPLAMRGLGDRAVDFLYRGPQSGLSRRYFRLQGALRFSWNPFFEYMRVIPKTEMLTEAEGGGVLSSIFTGKAGQINETRQLLRDSGMFDTAGIVGMGADAAESDVILGHTTGTTAQEAAQQGKNISKHLLPLQEKSIAGLVMSQADRMGMSTEAYVQGFPQQVRDTVQAIAQYDRHGNFINSPLARTLNVAFFPFRFETKVATIFAKSLARQPLMTQVAVLHGIMQAHNWFNSPQGQAWYSQNADALGIIRYITPIAEMNQAFDALTPGHDHSLGNFGEIGGLPFGWIPQLLDSEGLTHFNQAGVDAKTGAAIPSYVPATARGQLAIALQDFISSLFSYPGAQAGLPSKGTITRNLALELTGSNKQTDLSLQTPQLSPDQLNYQKAIQQANANNPTPGLTINQKQPTIPSQTVPGLSIPAQTSPAEQPRFKQSSTIKKKKGQFTPALLPGQTTYGQI